MGAMIRNSGMRRADEPKALSAARETRTEVRRKALRFSALRVFRERSARTGRATGVVIGNRGMRSMRRADEPKALSAVCGAGNDVRRKALRFSALRLDGGARKE